MGEVVTAANGPRNEGVGRGGGRNVTLRLLNA
jgi:hypothetical protein